MLHNKMNKLAVFLSVFPLIFVAACGGSSSSTVDSGPQHDPAVVGQWRVTTINGEAPTFQIGIEFKSSGVYATRDFASIGGCDSNGTWETEGNVLVTVVKAVSPEGPACNGNVGSVERNTYAIDLDMLTLVSLVDGNVWVFTRI
ncbi:MAG: META domain-containing protein [Nitrospinota bacterium]|nr:META domain-containing protein [Nitrospinota bacterium]MDH5757577.1 META domain-containing protein [Nitrospinota bacterium]